MIHALPHTNQINYKTLTSRENILRAWVEFRKGKKKRNDVLAFEQNLEDNLYDLYQDLKNKTYQHGQYKSFYVIDPKRRHIHKAPVRDRVVHHLLYTYLYSAFDSSFIYHSYSCRVRKGTHAGVKSLIKTVRKSSSNHTHNSWFLKCDVKKFFANVDHAILQNILKRKILDQNILHLLENVIVSFSIDSEGKGIPLGNLTSQIFANIYLHELDRFVKHRLKIRHYIRYADDFILLSDNKDSLLRLIEPLKQFLTTHLKLELHPRKMFLRRVSHGIDFLGYIVLPHYTLPRTKTKRRIQRKLTAKTELLKSGQVTIDQLNQSLQSYLGYLSHANAYLLTEKLLWQTIPHLL